MKLEGKKTFQGTECPWLATCSGVSIESLSPTHAHPYVTQRGMKPYKMVFPYIAKVVVSIWCSKEIKFPSIYTFFSSYPKNYSILALLPLFSPSPWSEEECGRKGLIWLTSTLQFIIEEVSAATWSRELKQRQWWNVVYWLDLHGLLSLLSYTIQDYQPREDISQNGLGPPALTTI